MRRNMGRPDRAIRIIAGAALLAVAIVIAPAGAVAVAVGVVVAVLVVTSVTGYCPSYRPLGIDTPQGSSGAHTPAADRPKDDTARTHDAA